MTARRAAALWPAAALVLLLAWSARLSATRIYQVDECYNATMARLLSRGGWDRFQTDPTAFDLALSPLAGRAQRARDLFAGARRVLLALFWLNIALFAVCAVKSPLSREGLLAALAAATVAPLWDYGLEIRHDNLLLTGLLLTWLILRVRPGGRRAYFAAGALAVALQFVAFKAFVWTVPLSAAFLLFPPPAHRASRRSLAFWWLGGVACALAAGRAAYGALGLWPVYIDDFRRMTVSAVAVRRLLPLEAAGRWLWEAPLLLVLVCAALAAIARERRRGVTLGWDGAEPEAGLFALSGAVLLVNPTPYAYNLVNVLPFAFLLVWRIGPKKLGAAVGFSPAALALAQVLPFAAATGWATHWTNARQTTVMDAAEALTGPDDPVYDGAGLVPTRPSIGYPWLLDTLNIAPFRDGTGPSARELLEKNPAAVILPSYRTDWLPAADRDFIRANYVPLADDLWVAGAELPPGGGAFWAIRAGRYRFSGEDRAVFLSAGEHRVRVAPGVRASALWTGPRLDAPPRMEPASHRRLFVDWY